MTISVTGYGMASGAVGKIWADRLALLLPSVHGRRTVLTCSLPDRTASYFTSGGTDRSGVIGNGLAGYFTIIRRRSPGVRTGSMYSSTGWTTILGTSGGDSAGFRVEKISCRTQIPSVAEVTFAFLEKVVQAFGVQLSAIPFFLSTTISASLLRCFRA